MTTRFYYEDSQDRIVDEQGNNAMDWDEEVTPFHLKTLAQDIRNLDIDMEDVIAIAKKLKEDKDWNIFEKQPNLVNRPNPQLDDRHKLHLLDFYDDYTQARVVDAMDSLTQKFSDLSVKKSTVRNFLKTECNLSFKKLTTQLAAENNLVKIQDCMDWVLKWSATDMIYLENYVLLMSLDLISTCGLLVDGAISAKFVVSMELHNPAEEHSKRIKINFVNRKRKAPGQTKKPASKGTITSHYMKFLEKILDEMDCFPELKDIIMDNAPIHTADQIDEMIVARWYKSIYFPPYSPELNPIEQFWAIVKNKVKRCSFEPTENLPTQITEAPPSSLQPDPNDRDLVDQETRVAAAEILEDPNTERSLKNVASAIAISDFRLKKIAKKNANNIQEASTLQFGDSVLRGYNTRAGAKKRAATEDENIFEIDGVVLDGMERSVRSTIKTEAVKLAKAKKTFSNLSEEEKDSVFLCLSSIVDLSNNSTAPGTQRSFFPGSAWQKLKNLVYESHTMPPLPENVEEDLREIEQ
ncbi:hypothetical protein G6F22_007533 [Rhizopus arrhizus]|nr:hypothetical protein G6F22_007533 [Rhizopus arrhizus]